MSSSSSLPRTSVQLYRDCLRLIRHVAPGVTSPKATALRHTVRQEFGKNKGEQDPDKIASLKANAVRALSNYMLATSARKDPKVSAAMKDFHNRSVQQAKQQQQEVSSPPTSNGNGPQATLSTENS